MEFPDWVHAKKICIYLYILWSRHQITEGRTKTLAREVDKLPKKCKDHVVRL